MKSEKSVSPTLVDGLVRLWRAALGKTGAAARHGFNTYIAAEHHCHPPDNGRDWTPVSSSSSAPDQYICPECGQHFVPGTRAEAAG